MLRGVLVSSWLASACGRLDFRVVDATSPNGPDGAPDVAPPNYCATLPMLSAAPVIDGVVDDALPLEPVISIWIGPNTVPAGISARYASHTAATARSCTPTTTARTRCLRTTTTWERGSSSSRRRSTA